MADLNILCQLNNKYSTNSPSEYISKPETRILKKNTLINIGFCTKFYFYIFGSALFKFFYVMILGSQENTIALFRFSPILFNYNSIQSVYTYLSYIFFGIIFHFCFKGKDKNKNKYMINNLNLKRELKINQNKKKINLQLFLTCFCFATYSEFQTLLYSNGYDSLDYWTFEIIFTFIFMRKYFEIGFYKHHKYSMFSTIVISTSFLFAATFFPTSYMDNQYQYVKDKYGNVFYSIPFILIFIIISFNYGFSRNYSKVLMQNKFVSKYILIIFIGIAGLILTLIISAISYSYEIDNFIFYYKELKSLDTEKVLREVFIITPLFIISQFMQMYLEILTIYYLNPMYCLMLNNICYGTQKIILFILDEEKKYLTYFLLSEISEIVAFFGYIIYLEIIELNFCGLNENIRRNIMVKGEKEFIEMNEDISKNIINNVDEDEDNEDKYLGLGTYEEIIQKKL